MYGAFVNMSEANTKDIKKLKKWYNEELKRRDKLISELKIENLVLLKTALKKSHQKSDENK